MFRRRPQEVLPFGAVISGGTSFTASQRQDGYKDWGSRTKQRSGQLGSRWIGAPEARWVDESKTRRSGVQGTLVLDTWTSRVGVRARRDVMTRIEGVAGRGITGQRSLCLSRVPPVSMRTTLPEAAVATTEDGGSLRVKRGCGGGGRFGVGRSVVVGSDGQASYAEARRCALFLDGVVGPGLQIPALVLPRVEVPRRKAVWGSRDDGPGELDDEECV